MKAKLIGHTQPVKFAVDELENGLKNIEDMIEDLIFKKLTN